MENETKDYIEKTFTNYQKLEWRFFIRVRKKCNGKWFPRHRSVYIVVFISLCLLSVYKLLPNNNKKSNYHTGVSDDIKKF